MAGSVPSGTARPCPRPYARRRFGPEPQGVSGLLRPLERRRPRYPHSAASQSRIRKAEPTWGARAVCRLRRPVSRPQPGGIIPEHITDEIRKNLPALRALGLIPNLIRVALKSVLLRRSRRGRKYESPPRNCPLGRDR